MVLDKAFGVVLKEMRTSQNITQEKLAFDSQLDRTYISLLERGLRQPTLSTIIQISKALNQPPELLISNVMKFMEDKDQ